MGSHLADLGADLRATLGLGRAVETGTFRGDTSVALAAVFPEVVTIELAPALHRKAAERFAREAPHVTAVLNDSVAALAALPSCPEGTMFFLDGHWSTGPTAGRGRECPVMEELGAIAGGSSRDCLIIDDARLFAAAPPPPHDPTQWPSLMEVFDALREQHPGHYVTLVADQVIAVPGEARAAIDSYARATGSLTASAAQLTHRVRARAKMALSR